MKLTNKIITLILLLLSFSMLFSCSLIGAEKNDSTEYVLKMPSKKMKQRFEKEYIKYMKYDLSDHPNVYINYWLGSFGDIHFLFIGDANLSYTQAYWTDYVADSSFDYPHGQSIEVWVNGKFLSMKEAYEQSLITKEMVEKIEEIYKGCSYIHVSGIDTRLDHLKK